MLVFFCHLYSTYLCYLFYCTNFVYALVFYATACGRTVGAMLSGKASVRQCSAFALPSTTHFVLEINHLLLLYLAFYASGELNFDKTSTGPLHKLWALVILPWLSRNFQKIYLPSVVTADKFRSLNTPTSKM